MQTPTLDPLAHKQYDVLDLPELFNKFAHYFHFTVNIENILAYKEEKNIQKVKMFFEQQQNFANHGKSQEVGQLLSSTKKTYPFSKQLKKIEKNHILSEEEFYDFHQIVRSSTRLLIIIHSSIFDTAPLKSQLDSNTQFKKVINELDELIDPEEKCILFTKHPLLRPIAKKIKDIEGSLRKKIKSIEQDWNNDGLTSQANYDFVDNKYIIPVRSDRYNGKLGKIISRSNTGHTLYVEPSEIEIAVNNKKSLEAELEREKYKILTNYTKILNKDLALIDKIFSYLLEVDRCHSHCLINNNFSLTEPVFTDKEVSLLEAFHPLIENPIKNNIHLNSHENGFLISGPNTGGKTITLKTLALHFLLPKFGFYVPSSQARLPFANQCYFFANDHQSLKEGLSSFSSESKGYLEIASKVENGCYIFIDEIFNSTSSHEASLIALALIKAFINKGSRLFISSHHEYLKQEVFKSQTLVSAHMGFETGHKKPSYRFFSGTPGNSFAIEVFKTLENNIIGNNQITIHLKDENSELSSEKERFKSISLLENKLMKMMREQETLKKSFESKKKNINNILSLEKDRLNKEYEKKWLETKDQVYKLSEDIKNNHKTNLNRIAQSLDHIKSNQLAMLDEKESLPQTSSEPSGAPSRKPIVNDKVYSRTLKQSGTVIKTNADKCFVQFKSIKTWLNYNDIALSTQPPKKELTTINYVNINKNDSLLYDARGMRREDFINEVEERIYTVINGDLPFLDIIHGHGDGILRKALYQCLKKFKELEYGHLEGNLGTTRISLK